MARLNFDFNPTFYFFENFCKVPINVFKKKVLPVAVSILKLHSMNEQHFLNALEIKYKPNVIDEYFTKYKASSFEECGLAWINEFINNKHNMNEFLQMLDASYACLLKMVLIHKKDKRNVCKKIEEFEGFMANELGIRFGRESILAMFYFSNLFDSFINIQSNMKIESALHNLKATTWDIFLLRNPEMLLTPSHLPELMLGYDQLTQKIPTLLIHAPTLVRRNAKDR